MFTRTTRYIEVARPFYEFFISYPAAINYTYLWNFGFYSFFCLLLQILSGLFLSMHYIAEPTLAFGSVEHIMRDVNSGWLLRYIHANGASFFFIAVYIHVFRGLYYFSYVKPRELLWVLGVIILLLMIITAFLGYVLPWGQMSFWGATVITNILSVIPKIGLDIVIWIWGGYAISKATLSRFYSFHFFFPFVILALAISHFIVLHEVGGNNPLGIEFKGYDSLTFFPYYIIKDFFGITIFFFIFFFFVFFIPNKLGHSDNYILANPLVTPPHIVPEWYLLPFYAILRAIPDKFFGALALVMAIVVLAFLPFYSWQPVVKSLNFRFFFRIFFWLFLFDCFLLGWLGSCPAEYPYVELSMIASTFYFVFLLVLLPIIVKLENYLFVRVFKDIK